MGYSRTWERYSDNKEIEPAQEISSGAVPIGSACRYTLAWHVPAQRVDEFLTGLFPFPAGEDASHNSPLIVAREHDHAYIVDMPRMGLLGTFEQMVLLSILQIGEEAYPPLILEQLESAMKRRVSRGSLYVTLDRLQQKGMVRSTPGAHEPERGGHPKRHVSVTKKGITALRECRESLMTLWVGLDSIIQQ